MSRTPAGPERSRLSGAVLLSVLVLLAQPNRSHGCMSAVGFVNLTFPVGYSFVTTPLFAADYSVSELFPRVPDGAQVIITEGGGSFRTAIFSVTTGWSDARMPVYPGQGCIVFNPGPRAFTNTFVGGIYSGRYVQNLPPGHSLCANMVPRAGRLASDLSFPAAHGDVVRRYQNSTSDYQSYTYSNGVWFPMEPEFAVGEAFWVEKQVGVTWVASLNIGYGECDHTVAVLSRPVFGSQKTIFYPFQILPGVATRRVVASVGGSVSLDSGFLTDQAGIQWQQDGTNLVDSGDVSGASTRVLNLRNLTKSRAGAFSVVVTNDNAVGAHVVADVLVGIPATTRPNVLSMTRQVQTNRMSLSGLEVGKDYRLQASGDMKNWGDVSSFVPTNATMEVADFSARPTSFTSRWFYRVVSP